MIPHVSDTKNGIDDEYHHYAKDPPKRVKWYMQVLLNGPLKVAVALVFTAILTPILVYQFVFFTHNGTGGFSVGSCIIQRSSRLPCGLGDVDESECHQQCCYDSGNNMCFHRFPSRFSYIMDQQWAEEVILRPRVATVPFKSQVSTTNVRLSLDEVSKSHLTITYYDSSERTLTGNRIDTKDYEVQISSAELNVIVNATNRIIYNTVRGPLIASENIWEIALKLTDETMYGFGEIPIQEGTVKIIYNYREGTNSIPLIFAKINSTYHGLLIDTVNPTEVSFQEDNLIVIRSITNFGLKFHLFIGPKPVDVMKDVRQLIGFKDLKYWMLGAHICSEYEDIQKSTSELNNFIQGASTQGLPFESHCVTPVVFDDACRTDKALIVNEGATILRSAGKKFVTHVSPYIHYKVEEKIELNNNTRNDTCNSTVQEFEDSMLQNFNGSGLYIGSVDSRDVVYPNYDNITKKLLQKLWVFDDIDGVVLENCWPLDESEKFVNETHNYLPYFSQHFEKAFNHTPQWNATNNKREKYLYTHNQYGNHFANAFDKLKPLNITPTWLSSLWMNGNVYVNRQNVNTTWLNLQKELTEAALGGISGQWFWSTPICGDTDHFNPETHLGLCIKWYMAAAFFPMIRIHSKGTPRDPLSFQGTDRSRMINALRTRMSLAPYFFSTLHVNGGGPLLRPMFYQFPESESLKDLSSQFSVGDDLVVVPNLLPNQAMVHMWMPPGVWYEMWSGLKLDGEEGEAVTMSTVEDDIFTAIRGGAVIALQKDVKLTADLTRALSHISLTIALDCDQYKNKEISNTQCSAEGYLYIDENTTIHFSANDTQLIIVSDGDLNSNCQGTGTTIAIPSLLISEITIYGLADSKNNYDHMRRVSASINLCELIHSDILFDFTI